MSYRGLATSGKILSDPESKKEKLKLRDHFFKIQLHKGWLFLESRYAHKRQGSTGMDQKADLSKSLSAYITPELKEYEEKDSQRRGEKKWLGSSSGISRN